MRVFWSQFYRELFFSLKHNILYVRQASRLKCRHCFWDATKPYNFLLGIYYKLMVEYLFDLFKLMISLLVADSLFPKEACVLKSMILAIWTQYCTVTPTNHGFLTCMSLITTPSTLTILYTLIINRNSNFRLYSHKKLIYKGKAESDSCVCVYCNLFKFIKNVHQKPGNRTQL